MRKGKTKKLEKYSRHESLRHLISNKQKDQTLIPPQTLKNAEKIQKKM